MQSSVAATSTAGSARTRDGYQLDLETAMREIDDFVARGYFGISLTAASRPLSS